MKLSKPMYSDMDKPIADQSEYRPPTQSQNSNIFALSIPNSVTLVSLVDKATKCFATVLNYNNNDNNIQKKTQNHSALANTRIINFPLISQLKIINLIILYIFTFT